MQQHAPATIPTAFLALLAIGCAERAETPADEEEMAAQEAAAPGTVQRAGDLTLVKGQRSTPGFPDARLAIEAPRDGVVLPARSAEVTLDLEGFETGVPTPGAEGRGIAVSAEGQHAHLILDNEPYQAIYQTDRVIQLGDLAPGPHVLRAFPSRQWHESVKTPGAFAMTRFFVQDTADAGPFDPGAPLLTYSRPKGDYQGADADSVMVDFYVTNVELGGDYTVRLTVDDSLAFELDEWVPYYLVGLAAGEHALRLELLGPGDVPVAGELNATERRISIAR